jgi:hypothetical protein
MLRCAALIVSLLLGTQASAKDPDPCDYVSHDEDRFGGGTNMSANIQSLSQLTAVGMDLTMKSKVVELNMVVKQGGALNGIVAAGTQLPVSFADGTVGTLTTGRDSPTQAYVVGSTIMTNVPYAIVIDAAMLETLASTPMAAIRIPYPGGTLDWEANKTIQKRLMYAAQCMRAELAASGGLAPAAAPAPAP